jgi:membrane-associated phospholipid phosphatase
MLRDASHCVRALWREKVAWSIVLTLFFCVPYFALQRVAVMPVRTLPATAVDEAIAFDPDWAWVYQSGYLLMSIVPWLIDRRHELHRYVRGFVRISLVGFLFFLFFPVIGPRPAVVPDEGMYGLLVSYDRPTNEFPSLHVALLSFTMLVAGRATAGRMPAARRTALLSAGVGWILAVAYAAVATRQHYAIDLPAGLALAWVVDRWLR